MFYLSGRVNYISHYFCVSGSMYLNECPRQPFIPIYLCGFGAMVIAILRSIKCDPPSIFYYCMGTVLFSWFIAGKMKDLTLINELSQAGRTPHIHLSLYSESKTVSSRSGLETHLKLPAQKIKVIKK